MPTHTHTHTPPQSLLLHTHSPLQTVPQAAQTMRHRVKINVLRLMNGSMRNVFKNNLYRK